MKTVPLIQRYKTVLKHQATKHLLDTIQKIQLSFMHQADPAFNQFLLHQANTQALESSYKQGLVSEQDFFLRKEKITEAVIIAVDQLEPEAIQVVQSKSYLLHIHRFDGSQDAILLLDQERLRIGRNKDNDLCLPEAIVSRYHCEINVILPFVNVVDKGSKHHTFIDQVPIKESILKLGMTLRIGHSTMYITDEAATD